MDLFIFKGPMDKKFKFCVFIFQMVTHYISDFVPEQAGHAC